MMGNFSRLYRNLAKSYLGWRVQYRKPQSNQNYDSITERIGYREISRNARALKKILNRPMLWKQDLNPAVQPVEINDGAINCAVIAIQLNSQVSQSFLGVLFKEWLPYIDGLYQNHHELVKADFQLNALKQENHKWQNFSDNLKAINDSYQKLNAYKSKDYRIYASNVHDVLTCKYQNAKGWHVEFLDKKT